MDVYEEVQEHLRNNQCTWLVTGAAGFIGSNLIEKLLTLNQRVIGLDNFETGYQHNLDQALEDSEKVLKEKNCTLITDNFVFNEGDIRNLEDCKKACSRVDYVLHQAALGSVPRSIEDPISINKANVDGFLNMLVAARNAKVKRLVYAASSSTYGDDQDLPKVEDKIGTPLSPYAVTKLVNELYAAVFARNYGFDTIGLRYFNVFGKRQDATDAYAAVTPKWIRSIIKGEKCFINGDGESSRDFCYIDNVVQGNLLAATTGNKLAVNQVYNVAVNNRVTLNKLYKMVEQRLMKRIDSLKHKEPIYRGFRVGDIKHSIADISKAQQLLGYHPSHNISEGLDDVIDWYISNNS